MTSSLHEGARAATRTDPTTTITIAAPRARVFEVITDPRTFPDWLLGAQKIRRVDDRWPEPGAAFHHTVGVGPIKVSDTTEVVSIDRPGQLVLSARIGPLGSARVTFTLTEAADTPDTAEVTEVTMHEVPESGPIKALWWTVGRWAVALGIWGRNELTLENLKTYVEGSATAV